MLGERTRRSLFMAFRLPLYLVVAGAVGVIQWQLALMSLSAPPSLKDLNTHKDCSHYRKIARVAWS
jgi:cytoskeletal protein RodZ